MRDNLTNLDAIAQTETDELNGGMVRSDWLLTASTVGMTTPTTPTLTPLATIEADALTRISDLLVSLKTSREEYQNWSAKQSPELPELRRQWQIRKNKTSYYDASGETALAAEEPGLIALPEVKAAKVKVAELRKLLSEAEGELRQFEEKGTPRDRYLRALEVTESAVVTLAREVRHHRINAVLLNQYGTCDTNKLPEVVVQTASMSPSVLVLDLFHFTARSGSLRDVTDSSADATFKRTTEGLERLKQIISPAKVQ